MRDFTYDGWYAKGYQVIGGELGGHHGGKQYKTFTQDQVYATFTGDRPYDTQGRLLTPGRRCCDNKFFSESKTKCSGTLIVHPKYPNTHIKCDQPKCGFWFKKPYETEKKAA